MKMQKYTIRFLMTTMSVVVILSNNPTLAKLINQDDENVALGKIHKEAQQIVGQQTTTKRQYAEDLTKVFDGYWEEFFKARVVLIESKFKTFPYKFNKLFADFDTSTRFLSLMSQFTSDQSKIEKQEKEQINSELEKELSPYKNHLEKQMDELSKLRSEKTQFLEDKIQKVYDEKQKFMKENPRSSDYIDSMGAELNIKRYEKQISEIEKNDDFKELKMRIDCATMSLKYITNQYEPKFKGVEEKHKKGKDLFLKSLNEIENQIELELKPQREKIDSMDLLLAAARKEYNTAYNNLMTQTELELISKS